jgi:tetratricopeptide (TPR) repeat protein
MNRIRPHEISFDLRGVALTLLILAVAWIGGACSQPASHAPDEEHHSTAEDTTADAMTASLGLTGSAVLSSDGEPLGTVYFPSSCAPEAREHLERGLALLHHMTYLKAEGSFRAAAEADPECAIAFWGIAMTYVHPLWPDVVPAERLAAGRELLDQAANAANTSEREQAYIEALGGYYGAEGTESSELERLNEFLAGWTTVHETYPEDMEAASFHALALLGTAPTTDKTYANQRAAGTITQAVLVELPKHPGGHHYTIHAYDFPPLAEDALATARSYDDVAPENSHALHMTSHIFTRRGLWTDSIEFNIRAEKAARERTPSGMVSMHRLHAMDYLAYAYLQLADNVEAQAVLDSMTKLEPPFHNHAGTAYSFAAVPSRLVLERHAWDEAAAIEAGWPDGVAWDQYPHLLAIPHFARAMGAAMTGDSATAETAIAKLAELQEEAADLPGAYDWAIQVEVQKLAAQAWLAFEQGDKDRALELMAEAAQKEASTEKNPVTPGEALPARELYGDMLLATENYTGALAEYEAALERSPNRFNSLFGAGRAAELAGDEAMAANYYRKLIEMAAEATGDRPALDHAKGFVG